MRTTFAMVNRNVQQNLGRRYSTLTDLQNQLATGRRINKQSDDPIGAANVVKLMTKQTQLSQYKRNIEDGQACMGVATSALQSMNEMLHRMRELAIQAANDTNMLSDRQYIQQETDQLFRQMMAVINTQFKGDYIFNGTQTKIPPYEIKASDNELMDYINKTMATYGGEYIIDADDIDRGRPGDSIYLHFDPMLKVGDRLQMRWLSDDANAENIVTDMTDSLVINTITVDDGSGTPQTFNVDIGDPDNPGDYVVDYRTGEITILSEAMRDALNAVTPKDGAGTPSVMIADTIGTNTPSFKYATTNTLQILNVKHTEDFIPYTNIFPGSLKLSIGDKTYLEGFGEHDPGYYDTDGVFHAGKNNYDYSVNYETGEITIYNSELLRDMFPEDRPYPNLGPQGNENYYAANKFSLTFEYITEGVNIHGDKVSSNGKIYRAIEEGIKTQINLGVGDILRDKWTGHEMVEVLMKYNCALYSGDRDGIQNAIDGLTAMYDAVLNAQSQMGARIYRFELTFSRNAEQALDVAEQRSALQDANLAEVISDFTLAQNIYQAALQSSMRVLSLSLANYM